MALPPLTLPRSSPDGDDRRSLRRRRIDKVVAVAGIVGFVLGSAIWIWQKGLFVHTDTVVLWVLAGLFTLTLTDLRRWGLRLFWDWLPLGALLVFYDQSAPLAKLLHRPIHTALQIHFDELLFGKPLLTIQLQHLLHQTKTVRWWEYPMFGLYMTHFFMALVVAGILWRFSYQRFREFRLQIVILSTLGFATYVLYPAAPPWYMGDHLHVVSTIYRTVFETWGKLGLKSAGSIADGAIQGTDLGNRLAAVPSMHAAISLFIACFFWRGARPWVRVVLVVYVVGMAFTLVYSGEHYVFDIVVGWLYTAFTVAGVALYRRYTRPLAPTAIPTASGLPLIGGGPSPASP
jgi:membrane-associated phospholipid phosphatase